jgi:dsDNA-specific endonuclease/ATPase MutS2
MRIQRAEYEAQLAQKRYEEVDPANRLVASTLESRWNQTLVTLEQAKEQYAQYQETEIQAISKEQEETIRALIKDLPRLWHAPATQAKDRKRILRLLVKDITVEKLSDPKQLVLHVRWQGGACEDIRVNLPLGISDRL